MLSCLYCATCAPTPVGAPPCGPSCSNLFNRSYATAEFLTTNTFNPNGTFRFNPDTWTNENAISPGAPFGIWVGMRIERD